MKLPPDDYAEMMENLHQMSVEYYNSFRFSSVMSQLKKEVDISGSVSDNVNKEILFGDVTNEDLAMVFSCLFDPDIVKLEITDYGDTFWQESVIYKGLEFTQIYGYEVVFIVKRLQ